MKSALSTKRTTRHSVELSGLASGTTYTYRAVSKDRHGNVGYSAKLTFTTATDTTTTDTTITDTATDTTTETCSSITQHGVTFTFDAAYPCGTFLNGGTGSRVAARAGRCR